MKYPYKIPPEFIGGFQMAAALHNKENWAVYIALMKEGGMSMTDLSKLFGGTYHELSTILDELERGYLVEHFTIWDEEEGGDLGRYCYLVTIGGYRFYFRLFDAIFPRRDHAYLDRIQKKVRKSVDAVLKKEVT